LQHEQGESNKNSIFQALTGLVVNGNPVPVYDSKLESPEDLYVIISTVFSVRTGNLSIYQYKATLVVEIFHQQQNSATNDLVDDVGEAIENIIMPDNTPVPGTASLPDQPGWLLIEPYVSSASNVCITGVPGG